jgi:hypothetical protein
MLERLKTSAATTLILFLLLTLVSWSQNRDARDKGDCGTAPGNGHAHQ